jgi:hypothetical protein
MLDEILEIFERDKRKSSHRKGGLRGRLITMLGGETSDSGRYASSDADRYASSDAGRNRRERYSDYDRDDTTPDSDDDDRYDDRRYSSRKKKRDFDPFDFGD